MTPSIPADPYCEECNRIVAHDDVITVRGLVRHIRKAAGFSLERPLECICGPVIDYAEHAHRIAGIDEWQTEIDGELIKLAVPAVICRCGYIAEITLRSWKPRS